MQLFPLLALENSAVIASDSKIHLATHNGLEDPLDVAGVYLITDSSTGKMYVGSTTVQGGIRGRWCACSDNGHGGNVLLGKLWGSSVRSTREISDTAF